MNLFRDVRCRLLLALSLPMITASLARAAATVPSTQPATQADATDEGGTIKVARGSLELRVEGEGVFEPIDSEEIRLKTKGYAGEWTIKSIVADGAHVKAGDSLIEFDDKPINKELTAAADELETAQANLVKAQSDNDLQQQADEIAMKVAQADAKVAADAIKWFDEIDGPQMIDNGDLQVKNVQYALDDQNDELNQLKKMYKTEDLTSATADIVIKRSLRQVDLTTQALKREQEQNRKLKTSTYPDARRRLVFGSDQQTNALSQLAATQAQSAVHRKSAVLTAKQAQTDAEQKLADLKADAKLFKQTAAFDGVAYFGQFTAGMGK